MLRVSASRRLCASVGSQASEKKPVRAPLPVVGQRGSMFGQRRPEPASQLDDLPEDIARDRLRGHRVGEATSLADLRRATEQHLEPVDQERRPCQFRGADLPRSPTPGTTGALHVWLGARASRCGQARLLRRRMRANGPSVRQRARPDLSPGTSRARPRGQPTTTANPELLQAPIPPRDDDPSYRGGTPRPGRPATVGG